jgi:divalent metal cation (Fe/Co/Zn/Cd) transporter
MVSISQAPDYSQLRRVQRIQMATILWMTIEVGVALSAAWIASSPALLAFGGDSAVELLSATVVLWEFAGNGQRARIRLRSARLAGGLLIALAVYVVAVSAFSLLGHSEPKPSFVGMAVLVASVLIMPLLAYQKRRLSAVTQSAALRADAAQSGLCAYLGVIALLGLAINATWHISWVDPLAALAITPLILWEAKESLQGKACGCCVAESKKMKI